MVNICSVFRHYRIDIGIGSRKVTARKEKFTAQAEEAVNINLIWRFYVLVKYAEGKIPRRFMGESYFRM